MRVFEEKTVKRALIQILLVIVTTFIIAPSSEGQHLSDSFKAGVMEYRTGHYQKSATIMDKLIQIEPDNYYARYYLAISLVKLNRINEARKHYNIILSEAREDKILQYARNGLKLIETGADKPEKTSRISVIEVDKKEDTSKKETSHTESGQKPAYDTNLAYNKDLMIHQLADQNNISPDELNNLIKLLAKNPSALQTLNKLATGQNTTAGGNLNNIDPETAAKLVKMMTMNSQMSLLNSMNTNNNNNNSNPMNMMGMLMGNPMMKMAQMGLQGNNGLSGETSQMQQIMNYMNQTGNQGQMNPDMLNLFFQNGMMGGFSGF